MIKKLPIYCVGLIVMVAIVVGCDFSTATQGEKLYAKHCQNCHAPDGQGLKKLIPPLAGSDFMDRSPEQIACIIRYGMEDPVEVNGVMYDQPMPANPKLTEIEIINIINYIQSAWGNEKGYRSQETVANDLKECKRL